MVMAFLSAPPVPAATRSDEMDSALTRFSTRLVASATPIAMPTPTAAKLAASAEAPVTASMVELSVASKDTSLPAVTVLDCTSAWTSVARRLVADAPDPATPTPTPPPDNAAVRACTIDRIFCSDVARTTTSPFVLVTVESLIMAMTPAALRLRPTSRQRVELA